MAYNSTILAESSLVAFYELNETSGTTAYDSSSNAYHGALHGTVTINQMRIAAGLDPCMLFDGSSGYISLPTGVQIANPLSVEMWIKDNSISANGMWVSSGAAVYEFGWNVSSGNVIYVAGNNGSFNTTNTLSSGSTYYVCLTIDGSMNFTIYAGKVGTDNAPSNWGSANPGGALSYGGAETDVGRRSSSVVWWKGYMSSLAIYNTVLTSTKMNNHYTAGTTAPVVHPRIIDGTNEYLVVE